MSADDILSTKMRDKLPAGLRRRNPCSIGLPLFCLGILVGLAAKVLEPAQFLGIAVCLAIAGGVIMLLTRLADRSDERLLAGDFSYRDFFDNAIEGIFRTSPNGRYLDANPALARIYGYSSPDALKRELTDISSQLYVDPNRRDEFRAVMQEYDQVVDFVSEIRRRDGATIWISENARAVRDWSGRLVCYQGTVEDVSAKFAAEHAMKKGLKRAEEANRTKNAFLAMMSHELKTPLNAIIGFSELIRHEMLGPLEHTGYRGYVNDIHASGTRLLAIINDVLDVARLEGSAIKLTLRECGPREIVELALARARASTGDTREVAIDVTENEFRLKADPARIAQALGNLLANALKFTPQSGSVTIRSLSAENGGVSFCVADTGIGMPPKKVAAALEPFRQLDRSLARRFEGAGLGLPIAKALTELHGGVLSVESAEGVGTTVTIALPPSSVLRNGVPEAA